MKYLIFFIILLISVVITAGCVRGDQNSAVTPTLTSPIEIAAPASPVAKVQDPIIGVWRISNSQGYDDRYRFNTDGTYLESFYDVTSKNTQIHSGTWSAQGNNSYTKREMITGISKTVMYDPITNAIYFTELSHLRLTPYQGDVAQGIVFTIAIPTTEITHEIATPEVVGGVLYQEVHENGEGSKKIKFRTDIPGNVSIHVFFGRGPCKAIIQSPGGNDIVLFDGSESVLLGGSEKHPFNITKVIKLPVAQTYTVFISVNQGVQWSLDITAE